MYYFFFFHWWVTRSWREVTFWCRWDYLKIWVTGLIYENVIWRQHLCVRLVFAFVLCIMLELINLLLFVPLWCDFLCVIIHIVIKNAIIKVRQPPSCDPGTSVLCKLIEIVKNCVLYKLIILPIKIFFFLSLLNVLIDWLVFFSFCIWWCRIG